MSKKVNIVLPDERHSGLASSESAPKLRSSIKSGSSFRSSPETAVFVLVSPENSGSSEISSRRTRNSTPSDSSLNKWVCRDSSNVESLDVEPEAYAETCALVRAGSENTEQSHNVDTSCSSIKQFLRGTVALVRAGESFTSVKQLFYNFIKSSSHSGSHSGASKEVVAKDSSDSQLVRKENPYLSQSNDTLLSSGAAPLTIGSPSQVTTSTNHSNFSSNPLKYDMSTSWLTDVTPLTGHTPTTQLSTKEADYPSDDTQKSYVSTQRQSKSQELAVVESQPFPATTCSTLEKDWTPGHPEGEEINISRRRSSCRSLPQILKPTRKSSPIRSPRMSPRNSPLSTVASEPTFVLVSSPAPHPQVVETPRSNGSTHRSNLGSVRQSAENTPKVSPRNSVTSALSQKADDVVGEESRFQVERISSRSAETIGSESQQKSSQISPRKVNFVFTLVSPEEGGASEPAESTDKDVEDASSCRTYQEECKCHHCQDMRRAVRRVEYFQSPEGQKRMQSKLLAKNFFMDLCALSAVRKGIQADLHGTRRHPPARVSYPVSICGACRLDGGSLTLKWFTHDLDCVDHFDFFVDGKLSRSVFNKQATSTVLIDLNASKEHRLRMRAVPVRGCGSQASPVDKLMSEVAAGHMRNVRQGELFACCLQHLDTPQQRSLVDFWTDSEFLYMPT